MGAISRETAASPSIVGHEDDPVVSAFKPIMGMDILEAGTGARGC